MLAATKAAWLKQGMTIDTSKGVHSTRGRHVDDTTERPARSMAPGAPPVPAPSLAWSVAAIVVVLTALLVAFHAREVLTGSIRYDDAFIAAVARNVALGRGYGTSYHDFQLFDPEISTGPTLILPAAALIWLFGNALWVPGLSVALAIWVSFAVLIARWRRARGDSDAAVAAAVVVAGMLVFGSREFGLLGELPAVLLAAAGLVGLTDPAARQRAHLIDGVWLGLAMHAKLITLFALPGVVLLPMLAPERDRRRMWRTALWCVAGWTLTVAAWKAYQLAALNGDLRSWLVLQGRSLAFVLGEQSLSGIGQLRVADSMLGLARANVSHGIREAVAAVGGVLPLLTWVLGAAIVAAIAWWRRALSPAASQFVLLLATAAASHGLWWLVISPTAWYRHLLPGLMYGVFLVAALAGPALRASRRATLVGVGCWGLSLLLMLPTAEHWAGDAARIFQWRIAPQPRRHALAETRDYLVNLRRDASVMLVGCGWWVTRDLEYALPGVNHFKDCFRVPPEATSGRRIVLVRNEFYNWDGAPVLERYRQACDRRVLFRRPPFVVSECPGLAR